MLKNRSTNDAKFTVRIRHVLLRDISNASKNRSTRGQVMPLVKATLLTLLLILGGSVFAGNEKYPSLRFRPELTLGKMTNGDNYMEIMPLRLSYCPNDEWMIGAGVSLGFEKGRGETVDAAYNHRGWKTQYSIQYKPLKFMVALIGDRSITDFAVTYKKQIGAKYDGSVLDIGRLDYNDYDEVSVGFDINLL